MFKHSRSVYIRKKKDFPLFHLSVVATLPWIQTQNNSLIPVLTLSPRSLLARYNSLMDPHLAGFFQNPKMRRQLRKNGLVGSYSSYSFFPVSFSFFSLKTNKQTIFSMYCTIPNYVLDARGHLNMCRTDDHT